jgi:uncharacterized membrane protein YkvA (DUF1232 family)
MPNKGKSCILVLYNLASLNVKEYYMAKKKQNGLMIPSSGGVLRDLVMRLKLIVRLMGDSRVNPLLKLLPVFSLVYLFFPFDLISFMPGVSALDDVAIVSLGAYLFVEFCPPDVVQEHMEKLRKEKLRTDLEGDIVDGEAVDIEDDNS